MLDNQLYILLKKKNNIELLQELFPKKKIPLIENDHEDTTWRKFNLQQQMMNRNTLHVHTIRSEWFLKDLHDKMNYMRG
ncbi:hypothetical protein [Tepidibacillus sp. LV47]|uniref:hypothetical protein n=1 Tax=Tepidibacillus sp. LV47 TaxID=3398228 RepID=UPI003AAA7291